MIRKPFEPEVFKATDLPAREAGIKLFNNIFPGITAVNNSDKYGVDLLLLNEKNEVVGAAEVEVKLVWGSEFRFTTLHFPERKRKFICGSTYFVVFNKSLTDCFVVEGHELQKSNIIEVKNYKVPAGEYFFDVPISKCYYYRGLNA